MTWNAKYHEFCLQQNMWSATINVICYIRKRCKADEAIEFEFDANKFQQHMKRTKGKAYHRTYISKIMKQAEEKSEGLVVIPKKNNDSTYKLLVRPISLTKLNAMAVHNKESL